MDLRQQEGTESPSKISDLLVLLILQMLIFLKLDFFSPIKFLLVYLMKKQMRTNSAHAITFIDH